jgi:hypothetical protein
VCDVAVTSVVDRGLADLGAFAIHRRVPRRHLSAQVPTDAGGDILAEQCPALQSS